MFANAAVDAAKTAIPVESPVVDYLRRDVDEHGLCTLTFDRANSSANIFDRDALLELDSHLNWLEREQALRGVILGGGTQVMDVAVSVLPV